MGSLRVIMWISCPFLDKRDVCSYRTLSAPPMTFLMDTSAAKRIFKISAPCGRRLPLMGPKEFFQETGDTITHN